VLRALSLDEKLALLRDAMHYLNQFGITSVVNATGSLDEIELYGMLRDRGELTVRTRTAIGAVAVPHHLTPELLNELETARTRFHDEWVSANLVKFFVDGSSGMYPPLVYRPAEYRALVLELDKRGYQLISHAERRDSIHLALDAYEEAERVNGPRDRRLHVAAGSLRQHATGRHPPNLALCGHCRAARSYSTRPPRHAEARPVQCMRAAARVHSASRKADTSCKKASCWSTKVMCPLRANTVTWEPGIAAWVSSAVAPLMRS